MKPTPYISPGEKIRMLIDACRGFYSRGEPNEIAPLVAAIEATIGIRADYAIRAEDRSYDAYQIVSTLLDHSGLFGTKIGQEVMDFFSSDLEDEAFPSSILPWPKEPLPAIADAKAAEMEELQSAHRDLIKLIGAYLRRGRKVRHGLAVTAAWYAGYLAAGGTGMPSAAPLEAAEAEYAGLLRQLKAAGYSSIELDIEEDES